MTAYLKLVHHVSSVDEWIPEVHEKKECFQNSEKSIHVTTQLKTQTGLLQVHGKTNHCRDKEELGEGDRT